MEGSYVNICLVMTNSGVKRKKRIKETPVKRIEKEKSKKKNKGKKVQVKWKNESKKALI